MRPMVNSNLTALRGHFSAAKNAFAFEAALSLSFPLDEGEFEFHFTAPSAIPDTSRRTDHSCCDDDT